MYVQAAAAAGIKVHSWEEFLSMGRARPAEAIPPKPEDLCTIMYTSGTTGNPKAGRVLLAHALWCLPPAGVAFSSRVSTPCSYTFHTESRWVARCN